MLIASNSMMANELKSFVTDGCTDFVDGTKSEPKLWQHCCLMHDMKYWYGGEEKAMDKADIDLKNCVFEVAGDFYSKLIYYGVRTGHHSPIKNKYAWGWGWKSPRGLTELTLDEKNYVQLKLEKLPFEQKYIDQVISESLNN